MEAGRYARNSLSLVALPRSSVARITDRPGISLAIDRGR